MQEIPEQISWDQPVGRPVRAKRGHTLLRALGLAIARSLRTLLRAVGLAIARSLRTLLRALGLAIAYSLRTLLRAAGLAIAHTLRWAIGPGRLLRAVIFYFVIGLGLLTYGFTQPGPCPNPNNSIGGNLYFVMTWPVGLYHRVYSGRNWYGTVGDWARQQACFGGRYGAETSGGQLNDELHRTPVPPTPDQGTAPTLTPGGPPAVSTSTSNAYNDGVRDRQAWEAWFNGLGGDEREGALHWASQRSLAKPGSCTLLIAAQVAGCREAQARLTPSDSRRKSEPDYRAGWNSIHASSN